MPEALYLDHNATTPLYPEVIAEMTDVLTKTGNASSLHRFGQAARRRVDDARDRVAALVNTRSENVVFTSGGSEANALGVLGSGCPCRLVSAMEHESVRQLAPDEPFLPVTPAGIIDLAALEERLQKAKHPAVVSIVLADGQIGIIQPVAEVAELAHRFGAMVHCDAVQAAGRMSVDVASLGVDLLSLSAHKMGGPQGVGALIVAKPGLDLIPLFRAGGQERGRRGGTENIAAISGFGIAVEKKISYIDSQVMMRTWRDDLERRLAMVCSELHVFGQHSSRLANTSCFAVPELAGRTQVMGLDLAGVAVSAGSACSSGKAEPPHALLAMGIPPDLARCAIRVSFGWSNVDGDVERFVRAWEVLVQRRKVAPAA